MSLKAIVAVLGGDLYDRGYRANIPAPGHSPADRSVSLLLRDGRIIVHTFGDGDWRTVLDHLREHRLIDAHNAPTSVSMGKARAAIGAVSNTDVERCRLRRIDRALPGPKIARHNNETPVSAYGDDRFRRPALLVGITDTHGAFTAVEVTYLLPNGRRAIDLRLSRKTVGPVPPGTAARIDPAAPEMLVAEGFFTTLSATERFELPGWALMSTPQPAQLDGAGRRSIRPDRRRSRQGRRGVRADPAAPAGAPGRARPDRAAAGAARRLERGGRPA
jgi:putative DNA primase/helicase